MTAPLLNNAAVRRLALELCRARGRRFTRVSRTFLQRLDRNLKLMLEGEIHRHPSKGVTLK